MSEEIIEQAAEIAREQVDPNRLLEGEDPSTEFIEDARHWLEVYEELIRFKGALIDKFEDRVQRFDKAEPLIEAAGDGALLELELQRFTKRAAFWRERLEALSG